MDNWDEKHAERLKEIKEFILMQDVLTGFSHQGSGVRESYV